MLISRYFIEVVFHGCCLLIKIFKIVLGFTNFHQSMSSFIAVIFHEGRLPFFQNFQLYFSFTSVGLQMLVSKFCSFPAISLLARVVVAQDMLWWLRRICGGGSAGYKVGEIKNKANSAQLELELGLSLATAYLMSVLNMRSLEPKYIILS